MITLPDLPVSFCRRDSSAGLLHLSSSAAAWHWFDLQNISKQIIFLQTWNVTGLNH
jgi:hypothetical protein